jgi:hypothetical protein
MFGRIDSCSKLRFSPVKCEEAFSSEEVDVILEDEFEDEILLDVVRRRIRTPDVVAQKWKTGQWKIVLEK